MEYQATIKTAEAVNFIERVDGLRIPKSELDERKVGCAPGITARSRHGGWKPEFDTLQGIHDRIWIDVIEGGRNTRHVYSLGGAKSFEGLAKGATLILE